MLGGASSWLYLKIEASTFDSNVGQVTNEIYFDQSLAAIRIGSHGETRSTWIIADDELPSTQLAKVIYNPAESDAKITVMDTDFTCSVAFDEQIVMTYNDEKAQKNAALFRIEQSSTN